MKKGGCSLHREQPLFLAKDDFPCLFVALILSASAKNV